MLIWVTGISGSGKTTIGKELYKQLKPKRANLIYLDGDEFRAALGDDVGYSLEDRDKNAMRITRLCRLLCAQGIDIICAANLTSQRYRDWCRENIPGYFEIFLDVPLEVLAKRDPKKIYAEAAQGKRKQVVGVDIPFVVPSNPDLVIDNARDRKDFSDMVQIILTRLQKDA